MNISTSNEHGTTSSTSTITTCGHCEAISAELQRCQPLTPAPHQWGDWPCWGTGPVVDLRDDDAAWIFNAPAAMACPCRCHDNWKFLQRGPVH